MVNIGWGTIISGTHGQFAERKMALTKIYKKFGREGFTFAQAIKILTSREKKLVNFLWLKNRNMIEQAGWSPDGKNHLWKLKSALVMYLTEEK